MERRRSDTDSRPTMLEPREVLGEAVLGFTGVGPPVVAGILRCGMEDIEDERDGGREFKSGDMLKYQELGCRTLR